MTTEQLILPFIDGVPTGYRAEPLTMANLDDLDDWLLCKSSGWVSVPEGSTTTELPELARRLQTDHDVYHDGDGNIFIGHARRVIRVSFDAGPVVQRVTLRRAGREAFVTGAVLLSPAGFVCILDHVAPGTAVYAFSPDNPRRCPVDLYPFFSNSYLDYYVLYVEPEIAYVLK